jgi:hypothetical protein
VAPIEGKAAAGAHIPLDAPAVLDGAQTHVNAGLLRLKIGLSVEVGFTVLGFHAVVGLAPVYPLAVNTDAHRRGGPLLMGIVPRPG